MSLKACRSCGQQVDRGAKACPSCGKVLRRDPREYGCCSGCALVLLAPVVYVVLAWVWRVWNQTGP